MNNLKKDIPFIINELKQEIPVLDFKKNIIESKEIKKYFKHYNLVYNNYNHYFGYFFSNKQKIAAHIFLSPKPKGTIFLLRGFLDHSGVLSNIISELINKNYTIACFDFQGHGLSDGARTRINNFSEYVTNFSDFLKICKHRVPTPYYVIAHSTGASVVFDYLYNHEDLFKKIIFVAPLVRSQHYNMSKFACMLFKNFIQVFPRGFRKVSSDKNFLNFQQYLDPLQDKKISIKWVRALVNWNDKIKNYQKLNKCVLIIQGTKDVVVDWKYNLKFFKKKLKNPIIKIIKNGRHQLFNEGQDVFLKLLRIIDDFF